MDGAGLGDAMFGSCVAMVWGEVVLAAIRDCPMALEHASDSIRRDREFIVTAMRISVRAAGGLSKETLRGEMWR